MKKLLIAILFTFPLVATAQQLTACRDSIKDGYDFWLYTPSSDDSVCQHKPLVMFLHGRSLCGTDLHKVLRYGTIDALTRGRKIDAYVVAPQTQGPWNPTKINSVYEWVKERYPIDTNRFYVLGMSLGGYGTLDFTATYPDKVAAAIAMCGGATVTELCGLNTVPLRIIHGTADKAVPVTSSDKVVGTMAYCGDTSRLVYDRLPNINHSQLARLFYMDSIYQWLFAHSLTDSLRTINNHCKISRSTIKQAYESLSSSNNNQIKVIDKKTNTKNTKTQTQTEPTDNISTEPQYYVIKKGDTLTAIASKYKTKVATLCKLNNINRDDILKIGKKIRVR